MRLFDVPAGQRVRITSKLIRWVEYTTEYTIAEDFTWEGVATNNYLFYKGCMRRMMVNHTVDWPEYAIWQRDTDCDVIE